MPNFLIRVLWVAALMLIIAATVRTQTAHNLQPIEYQQLQDDEKVQSFFYFLEQRIKLHDYQIGGLFFDSLITVKNDTMSRIEIEGNLHEFFSYGGMSDSVLLAEYSAKPPEFYPVFSLVEVAPMRSLSSMQIQDTVTVILTYQVSTTDSIKSTHVKIIKHDDLNILPITSYKIIEVEPELFYAISKYARNYILNIVGKTGNIPSELAAQDWIRQWDFNKDDPRPCVTQLSTFNIIEGVFKQIPFDIDYDGNSYSFQELTRSISSQYIDRNLIGHLQDFRAYARANTSNCFLTICDDYFNRILTMELSSLNITSMPGAKEGNSWGPYFSNLGLMSYNRVQSKLYTYDQGTRLINRYDYDPQELPGYSNEESYSSIPARSYPSQFAQTMSLFDGPSNGGVWEDAIWTSAYDKYSAGITVFRDITAEKRFVGFDTRCGGIDFVTSPVFSMTEFYLPRTSSKAWTYEKAEHFLVADANMVAVANADTSFWSPYQITSITPLWLYRMPEVGGGNLSAERTIDGIFYLSDTDANLLHVFEALDGRYLFSTRPSQFEDGYGNLKIARNLKQNWSTTNILMEDMYIARDWSSNSGISRFVPTGKIIECTLTRLSPEYCRLKFVTTSRTRISIVLRDSLNNEYSYRGPLYTNAGVNTMCIHNPNNYKVGVRYLPASNANYGSYSLADSMVVLDVGGAPKLTVPAIEQRMNIFTVDIWPTQVSNRYYIKIGDWQGGFLSLAVYDINGRALSSPESVYIPSGGAILTKYINSNIPKGVYIVRVAGPNAVQTNKLIKF